jgi:hypothetical protein
VLLPRLRVVDSVWLLRIARAHILCGLHGGLDEPA